ncbi:MAG TPA: tetratricopeptide repeat protein [bacterium]
MKCPFLVKRKDVFDKDGKKIGEDIEIQNCIKNECMVYDSAIKLCSMLSSNMKTGILIEDFKNGIKELREEMFQRAEATGIVISSTVQTMQDAMLGRFDILKKQNEVIALGFDRLFEMDNSMLNVFKESGTAMNTSIGLLRDAIENNGNNLKSTVAALHDSVQQMSQAQTSFAGDIKNLFGEQNRYLDKLDQDMLNKAEVLKNDVEKLMATSQTSMETINTTIGKSLAVAQDLYKKVELLDALLAQSSSLSELVKNEISGIKAEGMNVMGSIAFKFDELGKVFADNARFQESKVQDLMQKLDAISDVLKTELSGVKSEGLAGLSEIKTGALSLLAGIKDSVESMKKENGAATSDLKQEITKYLEMITSLTGTFNTDIKLTLSDLQKGLGGFDSQFGQIETNLKNIHEALGTMNHSYIESLGKIAGLAETMRQGVEKIGDGINFKLDEFGQVFKNELAGARSDVIEPIADMKNGVIKLEELFGESRTSLAEMSSMMSNLNRNYLESLSKIAGLAEGMRKGVDQVGEGMQDSVKDLVSAMKNEIGALEKQYETTFRDIARLADKFSELNSRLDKMTNEVQRDFKESFERQTQVSDFTRDILKNIKDYFDREDARYGDEKSMQKRREGIDHFDRSTLYFYRGKYELALHEVDKALEIERTAEYLNIKGLVLTELARQDEAKKAFWEALKMEPNMSEIYNNLGVLYLKMKKLDDAVAAFEDAIKRNVNYALAYVHLGKAFVEMEKYDDAMKAFDRALQIDPGNREAQEAVAMYREGKVG